MVTRRPPSPVTGPGGNVNGYVLHSYGILGTRTAPKFLETRPSVRGTDLRVETVVDRNIKFLSGGIEETRRQREEGREGKKDSP